MIDHIKQRILQNIPQADIRLHSDDNMHFSAEIIAPEFQNLSLVKRQQQVYAAINDLIQQGVVHALALKTYTPEEWQARQHG